MGDDYDYEPEYEEAEPERPRDRKIDEAKAVLMEEYFSKGTNVYYARQLEIWPGETVLPLDHGTRPS